MLQIDEENRISWPEIFNYVLLKYDDAKLARQIEEINKIYDNQEKEEKLYSLYLKECLIFDK